MPVGEMARGYLVDGDMRPKLHLWICPHCEAPYMHEPPPNKDICGRNKEKLEVYTHLNKHLDDFNEGQHSDPLMDGKGKAMSRIPALKLEPQILVCKVYILVHSLSIDGYKCPNCSNCSCFTCKIMCRHVCDIK
jgi:hypothetical protein